ncbi:MAG: glycosyltransferase involved in cell wall biosynthesis [Candidatus Endobugula sp.]|jgi:glycosyltransferase involved in cell wall biosynthesis
MQLKKRNILVYDSGVTGHHVEFLVNVIKTVSSNEYNHLFLLVKREIIPKLEIHSQYGIKTTFLELEDVDFHSFKKGTLLRLNAFDEIRALEAICRQYSVDRLMLMSMNRYQFAVAMHMRKGDIQIRGIIFNPYLPLSRSCQLWSKFHSLIYNIRKILQYGCMLSNASVERVFFLNDELSVELLNRIFFRKEPFKLLVDPLPYEVQVLDKQILDNPKADNSFVFIMFGAITPRKGVLEVLKAIKAGGEISPKKTTLRIVGEFSKKFPEWSSKVLTEVDWINDHLKSIKVDVIDRFVSFSELYKFLQGSNCVLALYINHSGSSGVIGHACLMELPLIVAPGGVMAEIVQKFRIGEVVDPHDGDSLVHVLREIASGDIEYHVEGARDYTEMSDYIKFGETLLEGWCG